MTLEQTKQIINTLKGLDLSTYPIKEIVNGLRQMRDFPAHATDFHAGTVIYRIRPNEEGKSFTRTNELSYKPQKFNRTFQRASHPNQTMFYGSVLPGANKESEINNGRVIAMAEGSKLFRDNSIEEGQETVTFSLWRLSGSVRLATILHPVIEKNITPFAMECAQAFMEFLSESPDKEDSAKMILEFYAEEFAKLVEMGDPDYHYLHSAVLTDFVLNNGFHGVCYPSGRVEGKGINVAIHPDFVDAHMNIEVVMECVIAKKGKHFVCENSKIARIKDGETDLNFEEILSPEQILENIARQME